MWWYILYTTRNRAKFKLFLFLFSLLFATTSSYFSSRRYRHTRVMTRNPERKRFPIYQRSPLGMDDLKFQTYHWYLPSLSYRYFCSVSAGFLRTAVVPGLAEMHSQKRHFQAAENRLTCAWFTSPTNVRLPCNVCHYYTILDHLSECT